MMNKPVGSPCLAQISLPWQQGSAHSILHVSIESAIPDNPLVGPNIPGLSAIQADLRFCENFGEYGKFWALGGLNQKLKNNNL